MKTRNIYLKIASLTILATTVIGITNIKVNAFGKKVEFSENISARSAVLYEPVTKQFLYEKNADQRLPMASTTKIMTAIIVADKCEMDEIVIIGPESVGIEGSSAYLQEGDKYTVLELLYALMLQSANDAATALANYVAGGTEDFAELMNKKAYDLSLKNTHFTNPHGLDNEEHYTTAKDLAIIGAELLKNETLKNIASTYKRSFCYEDRTRTYVNHNKLLKGYDGCTGMKTGFTKKSGRCLVSSAERKGLNLICVTLDALSDWNDHKNLLDFGFNSLEYIELCKQGDYSYSLNVIDGEKDKLSISAKENVAIIHERQNYTVQKNIRVPRYVIAPINKNDIVGQIVYKIDNTIYTIDLTADETILKQKNTFIKRLLKIFNIQDD